MPACWPSSASASTGRRAAAAHRLRARRRTPAHGGCGGVSARSRSDGTTQSNRAPPIHSSCPSTGGRRRRCRTRPSDPGDPDRPRTTPLAGGTTMGLLDRLFGRRDRPPYDGRQPSAADRPRPHRAVVRRAGARALPLPAADRAARADRAGARRGLRPADPRPAAAGARPARRRRPRRRAAADRRPPDAGPRGHARRDAAAGHAGARFGGYGPVTAGPAGYGGYGGGYGAATAAAWAWAA